MFVKFSQPCAGHVEVCSVVTPGKGEGARPCGYGGIRASWNVKETERKAPSQSPSPRLWKNFWHLGRRAVYSQTLCITHWKPGWLWEEWQTAAVALERVLPSPRQLAEEDSISGKIKIPQASGPNLSSICSTQAAAVRRHLVLN